MGKQVQKERFEWLTSMLPFIYFIWLFAVKNKHVNVPFFDKNNQQFNEIRQTVKI